MSGPPDSPSDPQVLTSPLWWRGATACAAVLLVPAALWRVVGQLQGSYAADLPGVVGTVVLVLLGLVTGVGAVAAWTSRYEVDRDRVVHRAVRRRRAVVLTEGTTVTLRRESRGGPTGFGHLWVLRLRGVDGTVVAADQAWVEGFEDLLQVVARAGNRHPRLLADPTLRAVLQDPELLEGSRAEIDLASQEEPPRTSSEPG